MRRQPEATANYKCLFFLDVGHDALAGPVTPIGIAIVHW